MRYNDGNAFFLFFKFIIINIRKGIGFLCLFVNKIIRIYEEEFRK